MLILASIETSTEIKSIVDVFIIKGEERRELLGLVLYKIAGLPIMAPDNTIPPVEMLVAIVATAMATTTITMTKTMRSESRRLHEN